MKLRAKIQQRNKQIKVLAFCAIAVFFLSAPSLTARAEEIGEKGENDTMETAELITANNEKPSGAVDGKHAGQSLVEGYTSSKDPDWYKVILFPGTNYITCYGNVGYSFRVTNSDGDTIVTDTYGKLHNDYAVYSFTVPTSEYYYIEFQGSKYPDTEWYVFMIGSPTYVLDSCKISCTEGSVSMTSGGGTRTVHFDGSSVSGLPRDAIASYAKMTGITTNATSGVRLYNDDRGLSFTLVRYSWYRDSLISMNLPVESNWTAEFEYNNKNVSFTPVLSLNYVYPVYE